jgi:hypothetical protein
MSNIVKELEHLAQKYGQFYEPDPLLVSMQWFVLEYTLLLL